MRKDLLEISKKFWQSWNKGKKSDFNRYEKMEKIITTLKQTATDLNTPITILAQSKPKFKMMTKEESIEVLLEVINIQQQHKRDKRKHILDAFFKEVKRLGYDGTDTEFAILWEDPRITILQKHKCNPSLNAAEIHCIKFIQNLPKSGMRYSFNGVPHVLTMKDKVWHSITYFCKTKTFRVFWPYKSKSMSQSKKDFKTFDEVMEFFK